MQFKIITIESWNKIYVTLTKKKKGIQIIAVAE